MAVEIKRRGRKPDVPMILAVKEMRGRGLSISMVEAELKRLNPTRKIYRRSVLRWMAR